MSGNADELFSESSAETSAETSVEMSAESSVETSAESSEPITDIEPINFATIEQRLNVPVGTLQEWSGMDGFPAVVVKGSVSPGIADLRQVADWATKAQLVVFGPTQNKVSSYDQTETAESAAVIEYVTIKIPVVAGTSRRLSANPTQSMRLNGTENDIRLAMAAVYEGCTADGVVRSIGNESGKPVGSVSGMFKWIFESVYAEMNKNAESRDS